MRIAKILNNNVVVTEMDGSEQIVMGRGLAFGRKIGEAIDESKVDKIYRLSSSDVSAKFQQLLADIPPEYLVLSDEIIAYAKTKLGKKLSETIYISLTDHLFTAITRMQDGVIVKNVLLWDIKRFFKDEFFIGTKAVEKVAAETGIQLPEDEAGFIALHIVNAEMEQSESVNNMYDVTKIMQEISNIVKYHFKMSFDEDSVYYYRFITHLKFFAQRLVTHKGYHGEDEEELLAMIKLKYANAFQCVEKISTFIYENYQYLISNEEKLYLTIHIARIVSQTTETQA